MSQLHDTMRLVYNAIKTSALALLRAVYQYEYSAASHECAPTMAQFQHYQLAKIIQLRHPLDSYDGWRINQRPPAVGDMGTILDILRAPGLPNKYVVESSDSDGMTIWLADFDAEELLPIDTTEYVPQQVATVARDTG